VDAGFRTLGGFCNTSGSFASQKGNIYEGGQLTNQGTCLSDCPGTVAGNQSCPTGYTYGIVGQTNSVPPGYIYGCTTAGGPVPFE
jgi:hypothetical protein